MTFVSEARRRVGDTWSAFTTWERAIVFVGSSVCGVTCFWTGQLFGIPRDPGFSGSLLASGTPMLGIIVVLIAVAICSVIGGLIATFIERESGLFCCCIGLAALGVRSGPIRPVLQYATSSSVFISLALETVFLGIVILAVWFMYAKIFRSHSATASGPSILAVPNEITDATLSQKLTVLGVQVAAMGVCELIFIQSDAKPQAMAGVAISAFLGGMAAYMFAALPQGIWYWTGPLVVGIVGYLLAYFNNGNIVIGDLHGVTAALARPTPLDYAGVGTAGALLGYWCSRRWAQPEDAEQEAEAVTAR